ncbi:hypothetical protein [Oceanisphaera sp. IT1-181]|uniref:hypothetical protein n=1 Tax=Oceanisphaera sp. IT1-181 TaxID=3081199 RepID=UPI0029CA10D0|nr:hypothetical protein [Oceanisphaera sp. IT1-181]
MNKAVMFAVGIALLGLAGFMYMLAGGASAPLIQIPFEALQGGAFFFAWGLGVPVWLSYLLTVMCAVGVLWLGFTVGYKLWSWVFKHR